MMLKTPNMMSYSGITHLNTDTLSADTDALQSTSTHLQLCHPQISYEYTWVNWLATKLILRGHANEM